MSGASGVEEALVEVRVAVPDAESARRIADDLVARRLAACVQVLGPMLSVYTWQEEVHRTEEWLLLVKSTAEAFPRLSAVVTALHGYDVPEVIAVPVTHALPAYGEWVRRGSSGLADADGG